MGIRKSRSKRQLEDVGHFFSGLPKVVRRCFTVRKVEDLSKPLVLWDKATCSHCHGPGQANSF
jgi:hypothetical protein